MIIKALEILDLEYPDLLMLDKFSHSPYQFLVAVMLSARSKDEMTIPVAKRLFDRASSPKEVVRLGKSEIEEILRPIGFYRSKTRNLIGLSNLLIRDYGEKVPHNRDELMTLPGVGRKTANVVLSQLFHQDTIAVDVHVHRISNRLGWVDTKTPEDTEKQLMRKVPREYWKIINRVMVNHGQKICKPRKPMCEMCPVRENCMYYKSSK